MGGRGRREDKKRTRWGSRVVVKEGHIYVGILTNLHNPSNTY
jgi:hypothetical protein